MNMTYDEAVTIVKWFGEGSLLRGLKWMKMEVNVIDEDGNPQFLTDTQTDAYYRVQREFKALLG